MKYIKVGSRLLLGLIFVVFGLNGFFNFLPMPPVTPQMGAFFGALAATGYFFPVLKTFEIAAGIMLLFNFWTPLGLIILSPIVVSIFCAHLFLDQGGLPLAIVISVLMLYLGGAHMSKFKALFGKFDDC